MPAGDRTGPTGNGPLTGRRAGFCAGSKVPGYQNQQVDIGRYGRGNGGRGRGRRNWQHDTGGAGMSAFNNQAYPQDFPLTASGHNRAEELQTLKKQATALENSLREIVGRIERLDSDKNK